MFLILSILTRSLFLFTLEWIKHWVVFKCIERFLLKICKASETRLWMLCFHWWAATPWSNPTDLGWTTEICSPRISQASKLRSHGTLFINSEHCLGTSAFVVHWICLPFQSKQYTPVTSSNLSLQNPFVRISWSHRTPREGVWAEIPQWRLRMCNTGNFEGDSAYQWKEGQN